MDIRLLFRIVFLLALILSSTEPFHPKKVNTRQRSYQNSLLSSFFKKTCQSSSSFLHSAGGAHDSGQIKTASLLDSIRKRPYFRYIGSTGPNGLHNLVWELVDNSVNEALAGHATFISTTINEDGSCTVVDDGRGIPTDVHPTTGVSELETAFGVLRAGGKVNDQKQASGYSKVSEELQGVGISVLNALSSSIEVVVNRNEQNYRMDFESGVPINGGQLKISNFSATPQPSTDVTRELETLKQQQQQQQLLFKKKLKDTLTKIEEEENDQAYDPNLNNISKRIEILEKLVSAYEQRSTGTSVTFLPDISVFRGNDGGPNISFDTSRLRDRMDEIAYLNAGLILMLRDKRVKETSKNRLQVFYHAGGLAEYVDLLCRTRTPFFTGSCWFYCCKLMLLVATKSSFGFRLKLLLCTAIFSIELALFNHRKL